MNSSLSIFNNTGSNANVDPKKSYTVVLNTAYGTGTTNSMTFNIAWDAIMPDVPYYLHFTYIGEANNLLGTTIATVNIDFGVNPSVYYANNAGNSIGGSTFIGIIKPYILSGTSYLLAEDSTNPPVYLAGRPKNNQITVNILNNDNPPTPFTPDTGSLGFNILQLRFVPAILGDN